MRLVSIHAPVKGATKGFFSTQERGKVSIHAPVKGATIRYRVATASCVGFNPRTREGCDLIRASFFFASTRVSIHAPVKGATAPREFHLNYTGFNPRTREGCDCKGARPSEKERCFNPRTREGCDGRYASLSPCAYRVSIHAPVKGATMHRK